MRNFQCYYDVSILCLKTRLRILKKLIMKNQMEIYTTYVKRVENDFKFSGEIKLGTIFDVFKNGLFSKRFFKIAAVGAIGVVLVSLTFI